MKLCTAILVSYDNPNDVIETLSHLEKISEFVHEVIIIDSSKLETIRDSLTNRETSINLKYVWQEKSGIFPAMNLGAEIASGEFLWFCNPGDFPTDSHFLTEMVYAELEKKRDWYLGQASPINLNSWFPFQKMSINPIAFLSGDTPISHQSIVCTNEIFHELGGFNPRYRHVADFDCIYRLLTTAEGKVFYTPFINFKVGGSSYLYSRQVALETFFVRMGISGARYMGISKLLIRITNGILRRLKVKSFESNF